MAGTIAQSPVLSSSVVRLENGDLISSGRKARRVRVTSGGVAGVNPRVSSGSSCSASGRRLQVLTGMRRANAVDALAMRSGKDFKSVVAAAVSSVSPSGRASRGVAVAMFERFTEKAIKVIMLAQEEARRLGHNFVGTEQILLGLIGEGTGIAAKVLKSMGVNLKEARVEVEKIIGRGSGFVAVEIPFTPRAKRVLELSLEEARQLGKLSPVSLVLVSKIRVILRNHILHAQRRSLLLSSRVHALSFNPRGPAVRREFYGWKCSDSHYMITLDGIFSFGLANLMM